MSSSESVGHAAAPRKWKFSRLHLCGEHMNAFRADLRRAYEVQSGSRLARIAGCLRSPGLHAVAVFRFGQWAKGTGLARLLLDPVYVVLQTLIHILWGIDLPRGAKVGPGLFIGHFGGITISRYAVIGSECNLSHGITIGFSGGRNGGGCPRIGDRVFIATGACVFGNITVGNNVKIGANAVVHRDIPDNAIVALDPGFRILSFKGNRPDGSDASL